jgi:hypothetical protein
VKSRAGTLVRDQVQTPVTGLPDPVDGPLPAHCPGDRPHYLQATFGANKVPVDEVRRMVGGNAVGVFGFDPKILAPIADRIRPKPEIVLSPPAEDLFPRGDVHKPLGGADIG